MKAVKNTSGAAPVWAAVMGFLHKNQPSRAPMPPAGMVHAQAEFGGQLEAARKEWFIAGTEQALFTTNSIAKSADKTGARGQKGFKSVKNSQPDPPDRPPRITTPANGSIIALDPDIPPDRQRLQFQAEGLTAAGPGHSDNARWLMDGKEFARGLQTQWLPWPGQHVVQLADAQGTVLDEIRLEVRGAGVRQAATPASAAKAGRSR